MRTWWPFSRQNKAKPERTTFSFRDPGVDLDIEAPGPRPGVSKIESLTVSTWHNGIRVISEMTATPPLIVYNRADRSPAKSHPLYRLLHDRVNPLMSAFQFRSAVTREAVLGNGYAEIIRDGAGRPTELWPVPSENVALRWIDNRHWVYDTTDPITGRTSILQPEDMLHITGGLMESDGSKGIDLMNHARAALALARQLEDFANSYFDNNAIAGGWIEFPAGYPEDAKQNVMSSLRKRHQGARKAFRWGSLEDGCKAVQNTVSNETNKLTELMTQQVNTICRFLNISPVWCQDLTKATWANLGDLYDHLVRSTLHPFYMRWEQECNAKLVMPSERDTIFVEHLLESLLRGNATERYANYATAISAGFMDPATAAEKENLPEPEPKPEPVAAPPIPPTQPATE